MSEYELINGLMSGLTLLLATGNYPEELCHQLSHLISALSNFWRMYLHSTDAGEKRVYLKLVLSFLSTRLEAFKAYPRLAHYLRFMLALLRTTYFSSLVLAPSR